MIARSVYLIILALCSSLPALAQEARQLPPEAGKAESDRKKTAAEMAKNASESPTFDDLRSSLGDLEQKESKAEKDKREAIVQKNYDDTLRIYHDALGRRNGDVANVNRRLDVNRGLEGKYDTLLKAARTNLASTRAQFINRSVALKKSLDDGKISREAYDKLFESDTKRFRNRERELLEDIAFYLDELQNAQRSAKDLATKKELMSMDPFVPADREVEREKPPQPSVEQKLKRTLADVSGYTGSSVLDAQK